MVKFDHMNLPVSDPKASRDWYVRNFGFTVGLEMPKSAPQRGTQNGDKMAKERPAKFGKKYTDEELLQMLLDAPTRANVAKHALRLERDAGAISFIYKFAMDPESHWQSRRMARLAHAATAQLRHGEGTSPAPVRTDN